MNVRKSKLPQSDDDEIETVESRLEINAKANTERFDHHFEQKNEDEDDVTVLDHFSQLLRLDKMNNDQGPIIQQVRKKIRIFEPPSL